MAWNYSNTAVETTLTGTITAIDTSITVGSVSGFPVSYPYTLVIDHGEATREVVNVTAGVSTTLTVTRGQDGTSASGHSAGATVVHAIVARDAQEPQDHIDASTEVHGLAAGVAVVGTTTSQTLTNKTISGASNTVSNLDTGVLASGTLGVARGGTGIASFTTGNYINASGATTLQQRTPSQVLSDIYPNPTQTYTPALTATTTNPTLGSGSTAAGRYWEDPVTGLVDVQIFIRFGTSGENAGSGTYEISLPTGVNNHSSVVSTAGTSDNLGHGSIRDNDTINNSRQVNAYLASATGGPAGVGLVRLLVFDGTNSVVTNSVPFTWAASDAINLSLRYLAV